MLITIILELAKALEMMYHFHFDISKISNIIVKFIQNLLNFMICVKSSMSLENPLLWK